MVTKFPETAEEYLAAHRALWDRFIGVLRNPLLVHYIIRAEIMQPFECERGPTPLIKHYLLRHFYAPKFIRMLNQCFPCDWALNVGGSGICERCLLRRSNLSATNCLDGLYRVFDNTLRAALHNEGVIPERVIEIAEDIRDRPAAEGVL